jgi:predicted dehydrogenase
LTIRTRLIRLAACAAVMVATYQAARAKEGVLRAGIIGCDTSHVVAFTDLINKPDASGPLADVEVTVAYPGGSQDIPASRDRIPGYVEQLRKKGVTIVDSLERLADESDVILLESVDGRPHLEQFKAVARGKPVFIDKPAAASLADVIRIFRHAEATNTPVFTSSSIRFIADVQSLAKEDAVGELLGCETTGPMHIESHHPDLFWYGVHGAEALFTVMGRGCQKVSRTDTKSSSLVVGTWRDGRIGTYRGMKVGAGVFGVTLYGMKGVAHKSGFSGYEPLVNVICEFFKTGKPPIDKDETIELFAFMEAADESKRQGGAAVSVADVLKKAEKEAAAE